MGIVSLLGDMTYEGTRCVLGPFLAILGASAFTLGLIVGFAEFAGYSFRLVSGFIVDKTRRYWLTTFIGYGLILALPLLALAYDWRIAAILIVLERLGKGIRTPARDTILSFATKRIGRGLGFGIHEALDQIGAFLGPIIVSVVLFLGLGYRFGFAVLTIPVIFLLVILAYASLQVPNPQKFEEKSVPKPSKIFWLYITFIFLSVAGLTNFQILSYHFKLTEAVSDELIPIFYAMAMGVDAVFALTVGKLYDKIGFKTLALIPVISVLIPLAFLSPIAVIFYGLVMATHETIMRSAVADLVTVGKRGTAYGLLNLAYGFAWFLGSSIIGFLYDISLNLVWIYVICIEILAGIILILLLKVI